MYSKNAMPQLTSAATIHGLWLSSFRCAYQANVMKTLLKPSSKTVSAMLRTYAQMPFAGVSSCNDRRTRPMSSRCAVARLAVEVRNSLEQFHQRFALRLVERFAVFCEQVVELLAQQLTVAEDVRARRQELGGFSRGQREGRLEFARVAPCAPSALMSPSALAVATASKAAISIGSSSANSGFASYFCRHARRRRHKKGFKPPE